MKRPKMLKHVVINSPANEREQKEYDAKVCTALATALIRCGFTKEGENK